MAARFWTKHFFAALVHTAAFAFLIGYAMKKQPLSDYGDGNYWIDTKRVSWEPIAWRYTCKLPCKVTADQIVIPKSRRRTVLPEQCTCDFLQNGQYYSSISTQVSIVVRQGLFLWKTIKVIVPQNTS